MNRFSLRTLILCGAGLSVALLTAHAQTNTFPASGNVGVGTTTPNNHFKIVDSLVNPPQGEASNIEQMYSITANDTDYIKAFDIEKYWYDVPAGVTASGYQIGLASQVFVSDPNFRGTIDRQWAMWSRTGINVAGSTGARTINEAIGLYLEGITGAGTILNHYGIFQTGAGTKNYFGGNVGIGTTTPDSALTIYGTDPQRAPMIVDRGYDGARTHFRYGGDATSAELGMTWYGSGRIAFWQGANLNTTGPSHASSPVQAVLGFPSWLTYMDTANDFFDVRRVPAGGTAQTLLRITPAGYMGLGTTTPTRRLSVAGQYPEAVLKSTVGSGGTGGSTLYFGNANSDSAGWINYDHGANMMSIRVNESERMRIDSNGNVGIGSTNPSHKLSVNGTIKAKEVIVETTGWSDYVFADDYRLAPLSEVEAHIKAEKRLPGIPSEQQVTEHGVSVGEMQAKLLAKIEELTLYMVEQKKVTDTQEKKLNEATARIEALERENAELRANPNSQRLFGLSK